MEPDNLKFENLIENNIYSVNFSKDEKRLNEEYENEFILTPAYEIKYDPVNRICRPVKDNETEGLLVSLLKELITERNTFQSSS